MKQLKQSSHSTSNALADKAVSRFAFAVRRTLFFKTAVAFLTAWLFSLGTLILTLRVLGVGIPSPIFIIVSGCLVTLIVAAYHAQRRQPEKAALRAAIDRENRAGGLVMAEDDANIGAWLNRLPSLTSPRIVWQNGRSLAIFGMAGVFCLTSALAPIRSPALAAEQKLEIAQDAEKLSAQVETLKNEDIIDSAKMEAFNQKLDQLSQEASGQDPAKTFEALDQMRDSVQRSAQQFAQSETNAAEKLSQTQALAEALANDAQAFNSKQMAEAMETVSALMEAQVRERSSLADQISPALRQALKSGALTKEQLKEIASGLGKSSNDIAKKLQRLHKAGLIDGKALKAGERAGKAESEGLADFLSKNASSLSVKEGLQQWGSGGVSRGRSDAPMSWGDETPDAGAKFKEKSLPASEISALNESQTIGMSQTAPKQKDGQSPVQSGALNGAAKGGGSAATQTILPKHRAPVRKYFERAASQPQ